MVSLSSTAEMLRAISTARNVTVSAYLLGKDTPVERALERAAGNGANVTVRLNGYFDRNNGTKAMLRANRGTISALKHLRVDARLVHRRKNDGPAMHLKAAVCDGVAFLSDRNWSKYDDTIIRDDAPADVHAVHAAALYSAGYSRRVQLDKLSALAAESRIITPNGGGVVVATEAIGYPSPVYSSLRSIAKSGAHPKLLISNYGYKELKHRHAAQLLEDAGVRVRVTHSCEKFAIAGRKQAWIGSANATSTHWNADEIEWGLRTRDPRIVRALESRFNRMWNTARRL